MRNDEVSRWRTSSYSTATQTCVEVGALADGAAVRDTKDRGAGYFVADRGQWSAFIAAVKADRFVR
ncbi:protein of unknown function [Saccharopolyspora kobensis]|uniref:DUF397 domain-containing protein n=1 Tax=Saccharopolyspora kobensis TaxID=146035 RepID=A0A1H6EDB1_9PSEU|nr:DUF397 domain-containing protein [Saccharopolyspora kobensis]SEG95790.1 protein of unknown function [Saccharopolyspora kobensis]SFD53229.1 protein of unknown function [Saccharopolyspora kobensis]